MKHSDFINLVRHEYREAKIKHPLFAHYFTRYLNIKRAKREEDFMKDLNTHPPFFADNILKEELAEATTAFELGDEDHFYQELAQCCAVIFRMLDFATEKFENDRADLE